MENNTLNYDIEFIYFLHSYLKKIDIVKLRELYEIIHLQTVEDDMTTDDMIYDFLDYLEIVSLILLKEFGNEYLTSKIDCNYASISLFGLNLTEISIILFIRFKNQEKVNNFIRKLKKYLDPAGVKTIDEILL
jgi:hypothetical protein